MAQWEINVLTMIFWRRFPARGARTSNSCSPPTTRPLLRSQGVATESDASASRLRRPMSSATFRLSFTCFVAASSLSVSAALSIARCVALASASIAGVRDARFRLDGGTTSCNILGAKVARDSSALGAKVARGGSTCNCLPADSMQEGPKETQGPRGRAHDVVAQVAETRLKTCSTEAAAASEDRTATSEGPRDRTATSEDPAAGAAKDRTAPSAESTCKRAPSAARGALGTSATGGRRAQRSAADTASCAALSSAPAWAVPDATPQRPKGRAQSAGFCGHAMVRWSALRQNSHT